MNKLLELAEAGEQLYILTEPFYLDETVLFTKAEVIGFIKKAEKPVRLSLAQAVQANYQKLIWHHKPSALLAHADEVLASPFYSHKEIEAMKASKFYEYLVYGGCSKEQLTDDEALELVDAASLPD